MGGLSTRMDETFVDFAGFFYVWSFWVGDVKTEGRPILRDHLGGCRRLPKRHPAWRRREAQPGSGTERENLHGDAKGKGTSGSNREAESTDAPVRART